MSKCREGSSGKTVRELLLFIGFLALISTTALGAGTMKKRAGWISATVARLKEFKPAEGTKIVEIRKLRIGRVLYTIEGEGLVRFGTAQWLYIISHSSHQEDGVGDAILAIDQDGNLYANDSHVCGDIIVYAMSGEAFGTVREFLDTEVTGGEKWKKFDPNQAVRETKQTRGHS
jgi:hypothetical protein